MSSMLITNIKQLVNVRDETHLLRGKQLAHLPCIDNAYLVIEDDTIDDFGRMSNFAHQTSNFQHTIDAQHQYVLPAWCDSHTHLVFAGSRENEFVDKLKGKTYAEIAARGGGILNSS